MTTLRHDTAPSDGLRALKLVPHITNSGYALLLLIVTQLVLLGIVCTCIVNSSSDTLTGVPTAQQWSFYQLSNRCNLPLINTLLVLLASTIISSAMALNCQELCKNISYSTSLLLLFTVIQILEYFSLPRTRTIEISNFCLATGWYLMQVLVVIVFMTYYYRKIRKGKGEYRHTVKLLAYYWRMIALVRLPIFLLMY